MTTLALAPDRWTFAGVDLSDYATMVRTLDAAEDFPGLRGDDLAVPNLPGRRWKPKLPDARRMGLALLITDQNASGGLTEPTAQRQAQANLDAIRTTFAKPGQYALVHVLPDGSSRTALAEVADFRATEQRGGRQAFLAVVDFDLADPYFYGPDLVDLDRSIASSPTAFALVNPGSVRTSGVVLDFTGPISNPRFTNGTNGLYVECLVTVAAATHLIVDCKAFTAANDGLNAIGSIRHSGDFRWMILEPGSNAISVSATSPGGTLTSTIDIPYHA
jgi:hypothetical protein